MSANRKILRLQKSHLSQEQKEELKRAEEDIKTGVTDIIKPPSWLNSTIAKNEWKRVVPQFLDIDVAGNLDLEAVAGYCNAFANYRKATEQLSKEEFVIITEDPKTGATLYKENPLVNIQIKWGVEMRRFADICGMTINSRLKAAATKQKQEQDTIEETFGAI